MSMRVLTREQAQLFDQIAQQTFGIDPLVLMENAGRGCVDVLTARGISGGVVICAGPGNNGGDGLVMARHLNLRGSQVSVLLFADPHKLSADARRNYEIARRCGISVEPAAEIPAEQLVERMQSAGPAATEWIVDAWLGTGARLPLRAPLSRVIPLVNDLKLRRMAVDLPTGLDADGVQWSEPVFAAHVTCTFVALKPVMTSPRGRACCGEIEVLDIGAPGAVFDNLQRTLANSSPGAAN